MQEPHFHLGINNVIVAYLTVFLFSFFLAVLRKKSALRDIESELQVYITKKNSQNCEKQLKSKLLDKNKQLSFNFLFCGGNGFNTS